MLYMRDSRREVYKVLINSGKEVNMAEFKEVGQRDIGDIKMFALSTCGWCKKTKAFLNDRDIKYSYIDVDLLSPEDLEAVREEQLRHNPTGSFPTIVVGSDYCIVGFDEQKLKKLVGE